MSQEIYRRARICGVLQCESHLHLGDGGEAPMSARTTYKRLTEKEGIGGYNSFCMGEADNKGHQQPYIPASSLRGVLRSRLDEADPNVMRLLGHADPDSQAGGKRMASRVRFYDAFLDRETAVQNAAALQKLPYWSQDRNTFLRHGIALDEVTGSVKEGFLFRYEMVPAESCFWLELEADKVSESDISDLLALLQRCFDGTAESSLGKGRTKGLGRMQFEPGRVEVLTDQSIRDWMRGSAGSSGPAFQPLPLPAGPVPAYFQGSQIKALNLQLEILSPLLVNEPGYVSGNKNDPGLEYSRTLDGRAMIPGTTIKGAVRARAWKILASIAHLHFNVAPEQAAGVVKPLLERLLGGKHRRSLVWFEDFTSPDPAQVHPQFFNAVDRFTGGVKDSALFNVRALAPGQNLSGDCRLDAQRVPESKDDWWKGLLLLVLREALEGDIALGWGKGKGFGAVAVQIPGGDWQGILRQLEQSSGVKPDEWVRQLHEKIEEAVAADRVSEEETANA